MFKKKQKSPWTKPELKVLIRGNSEEVVLFTCKGVEVGAGGPGQGKICERAGGSGNWCRFSTDS